MQEYHLMQEYSLRIKNWIYSLREDWLSISKLLYLEEVPNILPLWFIIHIDLQICTKLQYSFHNVSFFPSAYQTLGSIFTRSQSYCLKVTEWAFFIYLVILWITSWYQWFGNKVWLNTSERTSKITAHIPCIHVFLQCHIYINKHINLKNMHFSW